MVNLYGQLHPHQSNASYNMGFQCSVSRFHLKLGTCSVSLIFLTPSEGKFKGAAGMSNFELRSYI